MSSVQRVLNLIGFTVDSTDGARLCWLRVTKYPFPCSAPHPSLDRHVTHWHWQMTNASRQQIEAAGPILVPSRDLIHPHSTRLTIVTDPSIHEFIYWAVFIAACRSMLAINLIYCYTSPPHRVPRNLRYQIFHWLPLLRKCCRHLTTGINNT